MFTVDTENLRNSGNSLATAGEQLESAIEQFRSYIAGYGEPWGHDEIGMLVGMSFPTVGEYVLECCLAVADEYQLCGDDLTEVAEENEATDSELASGLELLGGEIGDRWA